ncbi:MAG: CDP-glycerol glycerophosphotransferase family protein [Treponema sp.]|nr:CDP-glycerol glycerophosphotransferase family protein [Treponema sp.]
MIKPAFLLYIDPGTGSMLFSIFIGLAAALYFFFRTFLIKIKYLVLGKRNGRSRSRKRGEYVIYSEGGHYWPVFKPVADEFERRETGLLYLTSSEDDPVFKNSYVHVHPEFIGAGNRAVASLNFLEADVCLMTTPGLEVYQLKRSKLCGHYSHILHDTGDATCYRLFGIDWYDSILLSGEYQKADIRELERLRELPRKELYVIGSTYLDVYREKIKNFPREKDHPFTVLVSPSWGPGALLSALGEKLLDSIKEPGWRIIVRPHPQSKISETIMLSRLEKKYPSFLWDYQDENVESLSKADIMISDFSGIIFDYAFLFDKPVLYHRAAFNREIYDAGDLEQEPWKFQALRSFGVELAEGDLPGIKDIILKAVSNTSFSAARLKAKERAWQNEGMSGSAAVDALMGIRARMYGADKK